VARGWESNLFFVVFSYASKAALKTDRKLEEGEEEEEGAGAVWDIELEYCSWEESVQWVRRREAR